MIKSDFISILVEKTGIEKKEVEKVIDNLGLVILDATKNGETIKLPNLGTFKEKLVKERNGVNPQDPKQKIVIPGYRSVKLSLSGSVREHLNA